MAFSKAEKDLKAAISEYPPLQTAQIEPLYLAKEEARKNLEEFEKEPYKWVYRPEMQFSVADFDVKRINRISSMSGSREILDDSIPLITPADKEINLYYTLFESYLPELARFGPDRDLVLSLGGEEKEHGADSTAVLQWNKMIFEDLEHLDMLESEDFLAIRLYQHGDDANVLWEFVFALFRVRMITDLNYDGRTDNDDQAIKDDISGSSGDDGSGDDGSGDDGSGDDGSGDGSEDGGGIPVRYICLNCDDDNENRVWDRDETYVGDDKEDDLLRVKLSFEAKNLDSLPDGYKIVLGLLDKNGEIIIPDGDDDEAVINAWCSKGKECTGDFSLPKIYVIGNGSDMLTPSEADENIFTSEIWVEGYNPGTATLGIEIRSQYNELLYKDAIKFIAIKGVDLQGHLPGTMSACGAEVSEADENDPVKLILLANDDNDGGDPPTTPFLADNDDTIISSDDDDIVRLTLRQAASTSFNEGTLELSMSPYEDSDNIRIFNAEGNTVLTLPAITDLSSPSGDLADLVTAGNLDVFLEGMKPNADLMIRLVFKNTGGAEICSDEIHLAVIKMTMKEIKGLYKEDGTYEDGYKSDDDKGRIYCNRIYDLSDLNKTVWTSNKQYIDLKIIIEPADISFLSSESRIVWKFEDSDNTSNDGSSVTDLYKKIIDPNDYDSIDNDGDGTADNNDGNDNTGVTDGSPVWEQLDADYALNSNETRIKDFMSKVRFNVTDDGGDNFKVKAKLKLVANGPVFGNCETGIMTVWKKIDIEYVKMASAYHLPVSEISDEFKNAFVQMDISLTRNVYDLDFMGITDDEAHEMCEMYVSNSFGEFSREGPGWFFIASALEYTPQSLINSEVIYPDTGIVGNATAQGDRFTLPTPIETGKVPDIVFLYNTTLSKNVLFLLSTGKKTITINKKNYHFVNKPDPYDAFLNADLDDYGFPNGSTVKIKVESPGSYGVGGISPGLSGKTIIFTGWVNAELLLTSVHEMTHGFGLADKCGNWDYKNNTPTTSCCMNYDSWFILDDMTPRAPIPWTNKRVGSSLCAHHIKAVRECNLEDMSALSW